MAAIVPVVAALLAEQAEAAGDRLLHVTDASTRAAAAARGKQEALLDQAARMEALLSSAASSPVAAAPPPSPEVPGQRGDPPASAGETVCTAWVGTGPTCDRCKRLQDDHLDPGAEARA